MYMRDIDGGCFFFFFKQKTAYEMRIIDWSSDVCSSDLTGFLPFPMEKRRFGRASEQDHLFACLQPPRLRDPEECTQRRTIQVLFDGRLERFRLRHWDSINIVTMGLLY